MAIEQPTIQSAEGQLVVVSTPRGAVWQVCCGGICLQAHSGVQMVELLRALRRSQGLPVPPG